jgi:hypothetical protein
MIKTMKAAKGQDGGGVAVQSVADILERELQYVIKDWLARVDLERDLSCIKLNCEDRTGHLPQLLRDVIERLRLDAGTKAPISTPLRSARMSPRGSDQFTGPKAA